MGAITITVMYTADEARAKARELIKAAGNCWTDDGTNEGRDR